jgi:hypothetical protein
MKKVAILQSNYIPWKGYFDMIAAVDEFILYDDMQYTRRDWRNRNQIKTPQGVQWVTVPVKVKGKYYQKIRETEIDGADWMLAHWKALEQNYRRAPYFLEVASWLEPIYFTESFTHLSVLNRRLIERVYQYLEITTRITNSWELMPLVEWIGFSSTYHSVEVKQRHAGRSSYSWWHLLRLAFNTIVAFSDRPLRISISIGFAMSGCAFIYGLYVFIRAMVYDIPVPGWSSLITSLYFLGGLILTNLGVVGVYLGKTFEKTKGQPLYLIARRTDLADSGRPVPLGKSTGK